MGNDPTVAYFFYLYLLYVLLPLVPAILIFKIFPETKVTVSGPLQNLTLNATGAFAAYVVTVGLGFFLVQKTEVQIESTRHYAVEGVIVDLGANQVLNSDQFYSRYTNDTFDANGKFLSRNYSFVAVFDHPVIKPETVWVKYWEIDVAGGVGSPPSPRSVPMELGSTRSQQRFRLRIDKDHPVIAPETANDVSSPKIEFAMKGDE